MPLTFAEQWLLGEVCGVWRSTKASEPAATTRTKRRTSRVWQRPGPVASANRGC